MSATAEVIETLVDAICALRRHHSLRVGINGVDAAGKTTLADTLAPAIERRGRPVLRSSIDDFHRPGHKLRSMREEFTPRSYYDDGYDYVGFRRAVLDPLGPGGDRRARLAQWSSAEDVAYPETWTQATEDTVLVVDGVFLLRPELADGWDYLVWVDVDEATSLTRAIERDVAWVGDPAVVAARYPRRQIPAQRLYVAETRAPDRADAVIDNRDPMRPVLTFRAP